MWFLHALSPNIQTINELLDFGPFFFLRNGFAIITIIITWNLHTNLYWTVVHYSRITWWKVSISASFQMQITVIQKIHSLWGIPYGNWNNKKKKVKDFFSSRGKQACDEIDQP